MVYSPIGLEIRWSRLIAIMDEVDAAIVRRHDRVEIHLPGGGGYGPPSQRSRERQAHDLAAGYLGWDDSGSTSSHGREEKAR